ncbi:cytochrome P450 [Plantactinospora siamensis]|uniref:Cytochrome P450 n=1 Tax=Plantactinospora siamensis TaxID=555372 RepID=A0ABV6NYU5_9ACTN
MTDVLDEPAEILGFDPFEPGFRLDPYPRYDALRARGALFRTAGGLLVATAHRMVSRIFRDPRFGHQSGVRGPVPFRRGSGGGGGTRWFVVLDPPDHTRLRRLIGHAFTPRLVAGLAPRAAELARRQLAAAMADGPGDLIENWAYPYSLTMISDLLGVPYGDRELIQRWSGIIVRGIDPDFVLSPAEIDERGRAFRDVAAYFTELVRDRRARPGDDLLGQLTRIEERGDVLTLDELVATCTLLLVAGHETVVDLLGNATLTLLRHPQAARELRDGDRDPQVAVDELLRYDPPVQMIMRTALVDCDVDGVPVRRGDMVLLMIGAANRDPAVYADPGRLDLGRRGERHLAFGAGIHYCLGAPLGRLEGSAALTTLVRNAPGLALTDEPLRYRDNLMARGLAGLPVRWR